MDARKLDELAARNALPDLLELLERAEQLVNASCEAPKNCIGPLFEVESGTQNQCDTCAAKRQWCSDRARLMEVSDE